VVQAGVARLARITRAWIASISFRVHGRCFSPLWDRQLVPNPFSRSVVAYGEPFAVLCDMSNETALAKIAAALDQVTAEADESAGTQPLS
jgi:lysophospholipid acyltransferase (LPLAT)-like uncharacterized protein